MIRIVCSFFGIILFGSSMNAFAQPTQNDAEIIRMKSAFTSFPDTGRIHGHEYDGALYDAAGHYSDNSVIIIVPKNWVASKNPDLIFWFHGWRNNIDSSLSHFRLGEQFVDSKRNAILVFAETAKNSPDSYAGKLEQPGIFSKLVADIFNLLENRNLILPGAIPRNIVLAGHSGAYRVMAKIIENGGLLISEVQLFDALYAEEDIFENWILSSGNHRFINIYTNHGGTAENSVAMMERLKVRVPLVFAEEVDMNSKRLKDDRVFFIHSLHEHNDIIMQPDNFRFFLENSTSLITR
jgi:hypothetical protein